MNKPTSNTQRILTLAEDIQSRGVDTREEFVNALMCMRQLEDELKAQTAILSQLKAACVWMQENASKYAQTHKQALDAPGLVDGLAGSRSGHVSLDDGFIYYLTLGVAKVKRLDGGKITQEFLSTLPKAWLETKTTFSVKAATADVAKRNRALNRSNPDAPEKGFESWLNDYGLTRGVSTEWTHVKIARS